MLIRLALPAALLLVCAPAGAQKPGDRNAAPADVLAGAGAEDPAAEIERLAAAAAAHPLGSLQNPVRVGGPAGARAYIARLRCADGSPPQVGGATEGGVGAYGSVTQRYALDCGAAAPGRTALTVDLYHEEHVENRAAAGFSIAGG
jgi:hypothetical protein